MSEPTIEQTMREYADEPCANGYVPIGPSTLREWANEVATLRAMQGEQSSAVAQFVREQQPLPHDFAAIADKHFDMLLESSAADPAPPEDALLRRLDALLANDLARQYPLMADLVRESRDRIAADAVTKYGTYQALADEGNRQLAAAEARAQGLEAVLKPLADAACKVMDGYEVKSTIWQDLWEPWKAANAAIARPEPSGKGEA